MTPTAVAASAERVEPAGDALSLLPDWDYADAFSLVGAPQASARVWAKLCLAGGPEFQQRVFGTLVWHGVLGFDLAKPGTEGTMVGWKIEVDEPDLFALKTGGRLMTGAMVFTIADDTVTWTTALHYLKPGAKPIWAGAQHVHRALAGRLLTNAARAIGRRSAD